MQAELEAVYGRRGSGKSTITKARLRGLPSGARVIVFDPLAEYGGTGWTRVRTLEELAGAVKKRWRGGFKISYVSAGDHVENLDRLTKFLWLANADYPRHKKQMLLVVEEANLAIPNQAQKSHITGMQQLILQGRHRGLGCIAITQRPAQISTTFRGNCAREYVFPLAAHVDKQQILQTIGPKYKEELNQMQPFNFLLLENGAIKRGKTTKTGKFKLNP
ncbi:ATP-binding protein [Polycladidibacter hongkongensis]|uniref:ATP-binding protein n=1 Tax=Polycladidibacter hongkongensis TaxID=1647556 RepID=UPI00082EC134|nr:ATP-binding protein [Pseudovibrio hongkongensis]